MLESSGGGWRTSRIFLAILWITMLVASLFLVSTFFNGFLLGSSTVSLSSLDWGGYVVASDFVNPQSVVTAVSGSWTVPRVIVSAQDTFSAAWIGIGGQFENTLIQTGTEHDSVNGTEMYSVWYELLPNDSITINTVKVSPGDKIQALINLVDSNTNSWSVEIRDISTGQSFSEVFSYGSSRLSAEWIVERPTIDGNIGTLANFGNIQFTDASATLNNVTGTVSSFPFVKVIMNNRQNTALVTVSALTLNGSSFTTTYLGNST